MQYHYNQTFIHKISYLRKFYKTLTQQRTLGKPQAVLMPTEYWK